MSGTALPASDGAVPRIDVSAFLRTVLACVLMTVVFVSLTPFAAGNSSGGVVGVGGSLVNQMGYTLLAGVALLAHLLYSERAVALSLLRPGWLLLLAMLALSAFMTASPATTLRGVLFTTIAMVAVTGALCLPPNPRALRLALAVAVCIAIAMSYFGAVVMPVLGRHIGDQHDGLWRGIYNHKNTAGAAMAVCFFAGVYLFRFRYHVIGTAIVVLSAFFILRTGSKTSLGLTGIVFGMVMITYVLHYRLIPVAMALVALAVGAFFTVGAVVFPAANDVVQAIAPGTTFTGRYELWQLSLDALRSRLWTGYGYFGFWGTPAVLAYESPMDFHWDPRGAGHSHNGFLGMALDLGIPGLLVTFWVLVLAPCLDYLRVRDDRESRALADFFLMTLLFLLLNGLLESFFFERAHPLWLMTFLSVAGLSLLGRFRAG